VVVPVSTLLYTNEDRNTPPRLFVPRRRRKAGYQPENNINPWNRHLPFLYFPSLSREADGEFIFHLKYGETGEEQYFSPSLSRNLAILGSIQKKDFSR